MPITKVDLDGNPNIGVFLNANDSLLLIPEPVSPSHLSKIKKTLDVEPVFLFPGTRLLGSLIALNNNGILFSQFMKNDIPETFTREVKGMGLNVGFLDDRLNALGNNILLNNKRALVHPDYSRGSIGVIKDVLGVEVLRGTISGMSVVGSVAVATDRGILVHPKITEEEEERIREFFSLTPLKATINFGSPYIGSGVVANNHGALVGSQSTGIEVGKVEEGLDLIS